MKIFRMNDCDWMAAVTLDEAKSAYRKHCGYSDDEEAFDEPGEIAESQYDGLQFQDEDGTSRSFRQQLQQMIERGESFPAFFASTER